MIQILAPKFHELMYPANHVGGLLISPVKISDANSSTLISDS